MNFGEFLLTYGGSHVVSVRVECSLLVSSSSLSSDMVVRVFDHILTIAYMFLLVDSFENIDVGVVFKMAIHFRF